MLCKMCHNRLIWAKTPWMVVKHIVQGQLLKGDLLHSLPSTRSSRAIESANLVLNYSPAVIVSLFNIYGALRKMQRRAYFMGYIVYDLDPTVDFCVIIKTI